MNDLEKMLADELSAPDDVAMPRVDVAGLARVGRAERRRRTGIGVAVAAAVAVVVSSTAATLALGRPDGGGGDGRVPVAPASSPTSVDELPLGAPSTAPWFDGRTLHAGGTTYDYRQRGFLGDLYAAGTTVATVRRDGTWRGLLMSGGETRELVTTSGRYPGFNLGLSADGRSVAVSERLDETTVDVTTYEVGRDEPLGTHRFSGPGVRPSFSLLNVTNDGRVVVSTDRFLVWSPGTDPVAVALTSVGANGISYPGGIAMGDEDSPDDVYGSISDDGTFEEVGFASGAAVWSPSGAAWAYTDDAGTGYVDGADRGLAMLPLPVDTVGLSPVGWEDDTRVVLEGSTSDGFDDATVQVRCDVVALSCERIPLDG